MGCVNSKNVARNCNFPICDPSVIRKIIVESSNPHSIDKQSKRCGNSVRFRRSSEAELVAAGWPLWLISAAAEAIDGWLPLKSENFERLEKIGQGTYSNVYRARDLQSGRIMALKKVRFDNFQPESVRFMAREIKILRRLDHPNVMKLEGIITSKLSCSIYLVFEHMEHDLSGLLSCPDVKFSDSQIKCYMWQLLKGIEHCHSRGVLHRDIKSSNILVNNEGVLKIADFGLANFFDYQNKPLTNRVVTLWYRPPELLLGGTSYGPYVDMWSVGCVFAELFHGRPILKGRTEVEQLHKIFKLCGSPSDEYWKKPQLPLAAMFRSQCMYESSIREQCKELPRTAVDLISTLLSVEPEKRVTARSALQVEYFYTKPYPCDPASMTTYPPNKEIDAKFREAAWRKKGSGRVQAADGSRILRNGHSYKLVPKDRNLYFLRFRDSINSKASHNTISEASQAKIICTFPPQAMVSNGSSTWETKKQEHLRRHQTLMQPGFLNSTQVFKPQVLSYDLQERKQPTHTTILDRFHSGEVRGLEYYYARAGLH